MPIRGGVGRKVTTLTGCLLLLSAPFRFSTCYQPPPLVRFYEYSIPQKNVLQECQDALDALGYETEAFALLDYHLVTKVRTIRKGLRKAEYLVFVKVDDRIAVYAYAETRVFRRGTELGLRAGELTVPEPGRLGLGFQEKIFAPITAELEKRGFRPWSPVEDNRRDDRRIQAYEKQRLNVLESRLHQAKLSDLALKKEIWEAYLTQMRESRWLAAEEAEQFVGFIEDSLSPGDDTSIARGWSLVAVSRQMVPRDGDLEEAFREILGDYPEYSGGGKIEWVINPMGRVEDVRVDLETSPGIPDDELAHAVDMHVRKLLFSGSMERWSHAVVSRRLDFAGHYHNLEFRLSRLRLKDLLEQFPVITPETVVDTFFKKSR